MKYYYIIITIHVHLNFLRYNKEKVGKYQYQQRIFISLEKKKYNNTMCLEINCLIPKVNEIEKIAACDIC